jgi:hypothetical protein
MEWDKKETNDSKPEKSLQGQETKMNT